MLSEPLTVAKYGLQIYGTHARTHIVHNMNSSVWCDEQKRGEMNYNLSH